MGTWSTSITGNDTAQDLRQEYAAAFLYYDVPQALQKIDAYVRADGFDESDSEEWCDYFYSLADFMWKKGILTPEIREKAIQMIDQGFGLEIWAESGEKALLARKKTLSAFREKLLSPQPPKKKIKLDIYPNRIFEDGDIVAIQLQTAGKPYTEQRIRPLTEEAFHALDGKYVLMQLVNCHASWSSKIAPEVKDHWATFRLFEGVYDHIPENLDFSKLKNANFQSHNYISPLFYCESSKFYFKKRSYKVLKNDPSLLSDIRDYHCSASVFFGINRPWTNPDSSILAAMDKKTVLAVFDGSLADLDHIYRCYYHTNHELTREENDKKRLAVMEQIKKRFEACRRMGGQILSISFGQLIGVVTVCNDRIEHLTITHNMRKCGFGTMLLAYAFSKVNVGGYIDVPKDHAVLLHICKKIGLAEAEANDPTHIRMCKTDAPIKLETSAE